MKNSTKIGALVLTVIFFLLIFVIAWRVYLAKEGGPEFFGISRREKPKREEMVEPSYSFGIHDKTKEEIKLGLESLKTEPSKIPDGFPREFPLDYENDKIQGRFDDTIGESGTKTYFVLSISNQNPASEIEEWKTYFNTKGWDIVSSELMISDGILNAYQGAEGIFVEIKPEFEVLEGEELEKSPTTIVAINYWINP